MKNIYTCSLIILLLGIFGCSSNSIETETQIDPTKAQVNIFPTVTNDTPFLTPMAAETSSPGGTANATETAFAVRQLLLQNDYCGEAPCIFGITPAKTSLNEAAVIFSKLGNPLVKTTSLENLDFYESLFGPNSGLEPGLSFQVILTVKDQNIKNLRAGINLVNYANRTHDSWIAYSPENILSRYGAPSKVEFALSYPAESSLPNNTVRYDMILYFKSVDLIFEYSSKFLSSFNKDTGLLYLCPLSDQFDNVSIWFGKDPVYPPIVGLPLQKASTLSIDEFHDALVIKKSCFDLDSKSFLQ
jgi:hypothetical protein